MQPGDLLFYGPGGSQHVAMYVGNGQMIEAPESGQSVHITPIRLADGFVGAGRP
jgi:cell wall-associated NlpC family hydrolase